MSIISRSLVPLFVISIGTFGPTLAEAQTFEATPVPGASAPAPSTPAPGAAEASVPGAYLSAPSAPAPVAARRAQAPAPSPYPAQVYRPLRGGRAIVAYRTEMRSPPELWGTGIGLVLAGWVLNFAALTPAANAIGNDRTPANEQDAQAWALVPFIGPMVQLGIEAPHPAIPILTGLLQFGGLVCFILGVTSQQEHRAAIYEGSPDDPAMLRVELDGGASTDGAFVGLTVRHL